MQELLPKLDKKLKRLIAHTNDPDPRPYLRDFSMLFDYPVSLRQFVVPGMHVRNMRVMELLTGVIQRNQRAYGGLGCSRIH